MLPWRAPVLDCSEPTPGGPVEVDCTDFWDGIPGEYSYVETLAWAQHALFVAAAGANSNLYCLQPTISKPSTMVVGSSTPTTPNALGPSRVVLILVAQYHCCAL